MGLQREPFHRVYSAPEPPSPKRRPRLAVLLVALVAFGGAAVAVFLLLPGHGKDAAAPRTPPSGTGTPGGAAGGTAEPTRPSETPMQEQTVASLPKPCAMVSDRTVGRTIPKARRAESANSTFTTCTYTAQGPRFRWLRVEVNLHAPARTPTPVQDAEGDYRASWTEAHSAPLVRTISLRRQRGIGDEAYRWFKADEGQPTVVGEVTTRFRNVLVTVSYSEQAAKGRADAREGACLGTAEGVAREVLATLAHF
ncbi:hypothetical protein GCM10009527_069690 [Actinomadura nitritigenes]|uniref:DUF3558 domain-containing protein n=1 Tax=Actinomadura nitritigenes TaxID=134602 RepID=A0ABS3QY65_9ACTN|nr:hypothetical protein [Actinomadura nitritigenes]MBO2438692.1 hypothetical protein [Actinomadura nitritigenes]